MAFLALTLLAPVLLLAVVELSLRILVPAPAFPLFVRAPFVESSHLVANRAAGMRWFPGITRPPGPMHEPFAQVKPARATRVFVLGESAAAGFPYPRNGTFSRYLREALRASLPGDSIEVINLGIAATNSYTMWDIAREVHRQRPDAILIYAGHNEYYGAMGVGSSQGLASARPSLVRMYLRALRYRIVWLLRRAMLTVASQRTPAVGDDVASLMEVLARDQQIALGGPVFRAGLSQFEDNVSRVVRLFRTSGVPVFLASVASNLVDQSPFAAEPNARPGGADETYRRARELLARGDTARARESFELARDLDVVRFRAPSELNEIIRRIARRDGAHYVPAAESLAVASAASIPDSTVFLEHVHPNRRGSGVIARAFFRELINGGVVGEAGRAPTAPDWESIEASVSLTAFDERVALHTVRTIVVRWPFVPLAQQRDYRTEFRPSDRLDSLAFAVSRGANWESAKLALAREYARRGSHDSAAAEYRGLAADAPLFQEPRLLLAEALIAAGRSEEAERELRRALQLGETPRALLALGNNAVNQRSFAEAARWFARAAELQPNSGEPLYRLALAFAMGGDTERARAAALRLRSVDPLHPGLPVLLRLLGAGR